MLQCAERAKFQAAETRIDKRLGIALVKIDDLVPRANATRVRRVRIKLTLWPIRRVGRATRAENAIDAQRETVDNE